MVIDGEFSPKINLSSVFWISLLVCGREFLFLHLFFGSYFFFFSVLFRLLYFHFYHLSS